MSENYYLEFKMNAKVNASPTKPRVAAQPETDAAVKLWVVMNRASRAVSDRIRGSIDRHDLSLSEFAVLEVLYAKGPLLIGEVGSRVLLTSGSTTYVIDKLQERGLVVRRPCSADRRALYVELTEKGRKLIAGFMPEHLEEVRQAMAGLTTEEQRIASALLKRLGRFAQGEP